MTNEQAIQQLSLNKTYSIGQKALQFTYSDNNNRHSRRRTTPCQPTTLSPATNSMRQRVRNIHNRQTNTPPVQAGKW